MKRTLIAISFFFLFFGHAQAVEETKFQVPKVRDDFCGVHINFQYCKCAFHDEYCEAVGLGSYQARIEVMRQFNKWVDEKVYAYGKNCIDNGGEWNKPSLACRYLDDVEQLVRDVDTRSVEEKYDLPKVDFQSTDLPRKKRGFIRDVEGEVFVWSMTFNRWMGPIRTGFQLSEGDFVVTRDRGTAQVVMLNPDGEDMVRLGKDTFFEIPLPKKDEPHDPSLFGILRRTALEIYEAVTDDTPDPPVWYRQLHTPTVSTGVRGTDVLVVADETSTAVYVNEGQAEMTPLSGGETVIITAGEQYSYINGTVSTSTLSKEEWEAKREDVGLSGERIVVPQSEIDSFEELPEEIAEEENDLYADIVPERNYFEEQTKKSPLTWILMLLVLGGGGFYFYRKKSQPVMGE